MNHALKILHKSGLLAIVIQLLRKLGLLQPAFRLYEIALATGYRVAPLNARLPPDGLPIPPSELIVQVAGTADVAWFLDFGMSMFQTIVSTLEKNGLRVEASHTVLEFGCGCGRVLRHWHSMPGVHLHGTDYNPRMVAWCRPNLPFADFATNGLGPPLAYAPQTFDAIYAISVFTHMSEPLQRQWLAELKRVLKPGGYLLFTTQGRRYFRHLTVAEQDAFDNGRLVIRYEEASGLNLCSAYHPEAYVRTTLVQGYAVIDFIAGGRQDYLDQDVYLLRKS